LTTDVAVISDTEMSLGWHVIIRQPVSTALAEVRALQQQIVLIGLIVTLFMLTLTYRLANRFSRPIENLAKSAHAVEEGQEDVHFEVNSSIREITGLSQSLNSMTKTLLTQKHQLMDANITLEQKVQERTQELEQANIELEKLARYDALTELYNRRALTDYLDYLYAQFARSHLAYAVLLMDVDFFKKVNDQYGHEVGDFVLKSVAQQLSSTVRESDFVARYGGEEFVVLLPATSLEGAVALAENLRHGRKRLFWIITQFPSVSE
jgi:diguanylate cyclase